MGHFGQHGIELVFGILLAQLGDQIGQHATGNLRYENIGLDLIIDRAFELGVFAPHFIEIAGNIIQRREIQPRITPRSFQCRNWLRITGCDVPWDRGASAVSIISTPASTAIM